MVGASADGNAGSGMKPSNNPDQKLSIIAALPTVSVVMPTYNRAHFLDRCLPPLFEQAYPLDRYEVVLVDDGSTDDTVRRAYELAQGWSGAFRVIQKANGGAGSARNAGWQDSSKDIIAFIDSDCTVGPTWLQTMVNALQTADAAGIGGPIVGGDVNSWVVRYQDAVQIYRHRVRNGQVDYLITPNVAFTLAALAAVGGFKETLGVEDTDLSYRLRNRGYRLTVTEDKAAAAIHYGTPPTIRAMTRNIYRYGYDNYRLSGNWGVVRRSPPVELARHGGAVILSPLIALRLRHRVGLREALSFWPLVIIEHSAFVAGMLAAIPRGRIH